MGAVYNGVKYAHHHAPASISIKTTEIRKLQLEWLILIFMYFSSEPANVDIYF